MITHALTVRQPWEWLMRERGKRIENRSWLPTAMVDKSLTTPELITSHPFALHVGAQFDSGFPVLCEDDPTLAAQMIGCPSAKGYRKSQIVGVARVVFPIWVRRADGRVVAARSCAVADEGEEIPPSYLATQLQWLIGRRYGWPLEITWFQRPILRVRGRQRFWTLRGELLQTVNTYYGRIQLGV